jgi:hypothetical protein
MRSCSYSHLGLRFVLLASAIACLVLQNMSLADNIHTGFPVCVGEIAGKVETSPVIFDYDRDGQNEIIMTADDHKLYIVNCDGNVELTYDTHSTSPANHSSPAVADLDGDGEFEIVFGERDASGYWSIFAVNPDGSDQNGFPAHLRMTGELYPAPTIYDLNGDGHQEILIGFTPYLDPDFYCVSYDGQILWSRCLERGVYATCAVGDGNGDFIPEIYVGTRGTQVIPGVEDGYIYCLNSSDGTTIWSFALNNGYFRKTCHGVALGDIDCDGDLELAAVTRGLWFTQLHDSFGEILAFDAGDGGNPIWAYSIYGHGIVPPAIGNITGDQNLEIVSGGDESVNEPGNDALYCVSSNGTLIWSIGVYSYSNFYYSSASVSLASFSSTSTPSYYVLANVLNPTNYSSYIWRLRADDGSAPATSQFEIGGSPFSTPAIDSGIGDADLDYAVGVSEEHDPSIPQDRRLLAFDSNSRNDQAHIEWGMYYHDPKHTGRYAQPAAGTITSNVAWYGKYVLWGNVFIANGATLRIEAGTKIEVQDGYQLTVQAGGAIIVEGEDIRPVVFTSASPDPLPGIWSGIKVNGGATALLRSCVIEYATNGIYGDANSGFDISDCTFSNCSNSGVNGTSGNPHSIVSCNFTNCGNYGAIFNEGNPVFNNNTISGNVKYGLKYTGDGAIEAYFNNITTNNASSYWGIYIGQSTIASTPTPYLLRDSVAQFSQGGIYINHSLNSGSLNGNVRSKHNGIYGIYLKDSSPSINGQNDESHNSFIDNKYGIYCASGCNSTFRWNNIFNNTYGVTIASGANPNFGTYPASPGNNRIENQQAPGTYEMKNLNVMTQIYAQWNYWGVDGAQIVGLISYLPLCFNNPIPSRERRESSYSALPTALVAENYPNPFNTNTEIRYALPQAGEARINVYDISGRTVKQLSSGTQDAGEHIVIWNGTDMGGEKVSSGVYFYSIITPQAQVTKKMLLLK